MMCPLNYISEKGENMKKKFLTITMLTLISLTSCGTLGNQNTYRSSQTTMAPSTEETLIPEMKVSPSPSNLNKSIHSVVQAFQSVLLNEKKFSYTDKVLGYSSIQQNNVYLSELTYDKSLVKVSKFAIADLDGDDISEIVLAMEDYKGFIILRYKDGNIHGNIVVYRTFVQIKSDGRFLSSNGASDNKISKIFFIGDTFITDDKISSIGGSPTDSYFINDIPIDKNTWDKQFALFEESPDITWHDYSKETILKWVSDDFILGKSSAISKTVIDERQNYLNSLSYLIDLTTNESTNQDEQNDIAKKYYNSCIEEMDKIFQMCNEKMSKDDFETLSNNQLCWKENLEQEMSQFLDEHQVNSMDELKEQSKYFVWGNMVLRRVCYLINVYYEFQV